MADWCNTVSVDTVRAMDQLPDQTAVLFLLNLEPVTGSHLTSLCRGIVVGPALPACAGITLVPVITHKPDGEWVALYITDSDILAAWPGPR
jgi:hypothetical protein